MNGTYVNRKENREQYIRTIAADQTAYRKQSNAGFYVFVVLLLASLAGVIGMLSNLL